MSIRPHPYLADQTLAGREWHGGKRCRTCALPKANQVHDVNDLAEETSALTDRILGEREIEEHNA